MPRVTRSQKTVPVEVQPSLKPTSYQSESTLEKTAKACGNLVDKIMGRPLNAALTFLSTSGIVASVYLAALDSTKKCLSAFSVSALSEPGAMNLKPSQWTDYLPIIDAFNGNENLLSPSSYLPKFIKTVYKSLTLNVPTDFASATMQPLSNLGNVKQLFSDGAKAETKAFCLEAKSYSDNLMMIYAISATLIATKILYTAAKPVITALFHKIISK